MEEFQWVEKYRPQTVEGCVLPKYLKDKFQAFVNQGNIPNLLLVGPPGPGKTTVAKAMCDELEIDWYIINGSLKGDINTLRTDISNFASSISFRRKRKYVILDEADYLTNATQPALRNFMEEYSANCGFILTANYLNKIITALRSRCSVIDFNFPKEEAPELGFKFFNCCTEILKTENVKYDRETVAATINLFYPDFRRVLHELQSHSATGTLDPSILKANIISLPDIMKALKKQDFTKLRDLAATYGTIPEDVFRTVYDSADEYFTDSFTGELIEIIAEYQFKQAFVADAEINLAAFLVQVSHTVGDAWK